MTAPEPMGYAEAMAELEVILRELDRDDLDVDRLSDRVRRASELITLCRARIERARAEVDQIVVDLDAFDRESTNDVPAESGVSSPSKEGNAP